MIKLIGVVVDCVLLVADVTLKCVTIFGKVKRKKEPDANEKS